MKKVFIVLGIICLPFISQAYFDTSLKYGSKGEAVIELQEFLQDQDIFQGTIDGKFGLKTLKAVKAFQLSQGLKADGYFGKASREKANLILENILKDSKEAEQEEIINVGTPTPIEPVITQPTPTTPVFQEVIIPPDPIYVQAPVENLQDLTITDITANEASEYNGETAKRIIENCRVFKAEVKDNDGNKVNDAVVKMTVSTRPNSIDYFARKVQFCSNGQEWGNITFTFEYKELKLKKDVVVNLVQPKE